MTPIKLSKTRMVPFSEEPKLPRIVATVNNKGGCGKTTTTISLGMTLARYGKNVLFADFDPQCNLTQKLGIADMTYMDHRLNKFLEDMRVSERTERSLICEYRGLRKMMAGEGKVGRIGVLSGSRESEGYASYLKDQLGKTFDTASVTEYFKDMARVYGKYYDYIVIDTAPSIMGNSLCEVAIKNATDIIIPTDGIEAAYGLRSVLGWIYNANKEADIIIPMVKYQLETDSIAEGPSTLESRSSVYRALRDSFEDFVCKNGVKETKLIRHGVYGIPGFGGRTEYTTLAEEIMERLRGPPKRLPEKDILSGKITLFENNLKAIDERIFQMKPLTLKRGVYQ